MVLSKMTFFTYVMLSGFSALGPFLSVLKQNNINMDSSYIQYGDTQIGFKRFYLNEPELRPFEYHPVSVFSKISGFSSITFFLEVMERSFLYILASYNCQEAAEIGNLKFYSNGAKLRPFMYTRFGHFSHLIFWKIFPRGKWGTNGVYILATILKEPKQLKNRKSV